MESEKKLKEIADEIAVCKLCQLSYSRKKAVPGEGSPGAEMMLIGEGPGFYENEQGRPFVGAAGNYLNELLEKASVSRKDVFITNVVKCRPPGNRDPLPEELSACNTYLERQIASINPLVIVTLGRISMARFLPNVRISEVHGQPAWVKGRLIVPMFHPAAALHQPSLKTSVERDFARLPEWIEQARNSDRHVAAQLDSQPALVTGTPGAPVTEARPNMLFDLDALDDEKPEEEAASENADTDDAPTQLRLF